METLKAVKGVNGLRLDGVHQSNCNTLIVDCGDVHKNDVIVKVLAAYRRDYLLAEEFNRGGTIWLIFFNVNILEDYMGFSLSDLSATNSKTIDVKELSLRRIVKKYLDLEEG